jgi:hypothetical protein
MRTRRAKQERPDPYVFGRPAPKDRDHYSRQVTQIEAKPAGVLILNVALTLECGHKIEGRAHEKKRRIPTRIFCKECYQAACQTAMSEAAKPPAMTPAHAKGHLRKASHARPHN